MRKRLINFLVAALFLCAAGSGLAQTKPVAADIREIILETGDGFCFDCERITTLRSDGTATYHGGQKSNFRRGDFYGGFGAAEFARLANAFLEAGFFDLKPRYEGSTSDVATVKITVVYQGGRKSIENFGRSDEPNLKIIERAFNQAANDIEWRVYDVRLEAKPPAVIEAFAHLKPAHAAAVKNYLGMRKNIRPALETDCQNTDGLGIMRELYGAKYQPYYAAFDFDRDGAEDFAVVLYDWRANLESRFTIVVFKGAANETFKPSLIVPEIDLSLGGFELADSPKGAVELRTIHFQIEQGCAVFKWRKQKIVLAKCPTNKN